jgi:V/A-type H+-transporting ATPase subunit A
MEKQYEILKAILYFHHKALEAIEHGADTKDLFSLKVWEMIARAKYVEEAQMAQIVDIRRQIDEQIKALTSKAAA